MLAGLVASLSWLEIVVVSIGLVAVVAWMIGFRKARAIKSRMEGVSETKAIPDVEKVSWILVRGLKMPWAS